MNKRFIVSLVKNGIVGGDIVVDSDAIIYRTNKVTIPKEYRCLVMKYKDICEVTKGWLVILPMVIVKMRSGEEYKFVIFFSRKRFLNTLISVGVDAF